MTTIKVYVKHLRNESFLVEDQNDRDRIVRLKAWCAVAMFVLCFAVVVGCQSKSKNIVNKVAAGRLPQLRNPSAEVLAELVANPEKAKVSNVWLTSMDLSDPEWAHLKDLSGLVEITGLHFHSTKNTDAFVDSLPAGDKVTTLEFYETDLSDSGMAAILKLGQLEELRVEFPSKKISKASLAELKSLGSLKKLHLASDRKLSPSTFEAMLPGCEVVIDYLPAGTWRN